MEVEDNEKKFATSTTAVPRIPPHLCRLLLILDNELVRDLFALYALV